MRIIRFSPILAVLVAALAVSPASAAPSLSLGSSASYQLNASLTRFDNCTSTNITIAAVACGSTVPFQTSAYVNVNDDGVCFSADTFCNFSPKNVTVITSGSVNWQNFGSLNHTVTSDTPTIFDFTLFRRNNTFPFTNSFHQFSFPSAGSYSYHCNIHPWMKGLVIVVQPTPVPPKLQSFSLSGPLGWTVAGLDDEAQLDIHHQISEYNASSTPPQRLYNETGTTGDTIDLSTRKDSSPGLNPLQFINSLPFQIGGSTLLFPGYYGYPYGYPYGYAPLEVYTVWWVNGPLKIGSTVEVLTFHSAVRASESVNLGTIPGSHDAWVVSSKDSEAFNQTQPTSQFGYYCYTPYYGQYPGPGGYYPSPQCYTSGLSNSVSMKLDYGQRSDLLFSLDAVLDAYTQTTTVYPAGSFVYGQYYGQGVQVSSAVNVVRTSRSTSSVSLTLASTTMDLASRTVPPATSSSGSPVSGLARSMLPLLMYGTVSVAAAGLVGAGVWIVVRARKKSQPVPSFLIASQTV